MSSTPPIETSGRECRAVRALLPRLPEDDLAPEERSRVDAHLDGCAQCREEARAYRGIAALLRDEPDPAAALPSGSRVATWVLEREAGRPRPTLWLPGLSLAAAALALVAWFGSRPAETPGTAALRPAVASLPALVVIDDERTGRQVLLGPGTPAERP